MALSGAELDKWMKVFQRFDVNKNGSLTLEEAFMGFEEYPSDYAKTVFSQVCFLRHIK